MTITTPMVRALDSQVDIARTHLNHLRRAEIIDVLTFTEWGYELNCIEDRIGALYATVYTRDLEPEVQAIEQDLETFSRRSLNAKKPQPSRLHAYVALILIGSCMLLGGCGIDRIQPYPSRPWDQEPRNVWDIQDVGNHY